MKQKYMVMCMKSEAMATTGQKVDLTSLEHGCCGLIPVFRTKKAAQKFAGKKYQIVPVMEGIS